MSLARAIKLRVMQAVDIATHTRTPLPCYADWLKLRTQPYAVRTRDGIELEIRPGGGDRFAFYETVIRRDYLQQGFAPLPGQTVVDIGGNIGGFAIVAGRLVGSEGRVITVEPEPQSFKQLETNLRRNKLEHVTAVQAAIGAQDGAVRIVPHDNPLLNRVEAIENQQSADDAAVPCLTLDRLLDDNRIERCDLMKIDCEGAEYEIFESMPQGTAARIDRIVMETHPNRDRRDDQLHRRMAALGFKLRIGSEALTVAWREGAAPA